MIHTVHNHSYNNQPLPKKAQNICASKLLAHTKILALAKYTKI
jgi:hypothetical protein